MSPSLGSKQIDHTPSPQATPTPGQTSPPPVSYTPKNGNAAAAEPINSNAAAVTSSATPTNGEIPTEMITSPIPGPSRSDSVSSDCGVVYFDPGIPGESRIPATGNAVRDRCRELLSKAMMKGFDKGRNKD